MNSLAAAREQPMPSEMRRALSEALDRLTRTREARIEAKPVAPPEERRRIVLSRRTRQQMMALLRHASHAAGGRASHNDGVRAVWGWLRQVGLDRGSDSLIAALTSGFTRLPVEQPALAPPGSIIVTANTAAVKGFGHRFYGDGELDHIAGDVLGIYAPK
jgi:hypothetical protein